MALTTAQRRARALVAAAADDPDAAAHMVYSWSPVELRQITLALASSVVLTVPGVTISLRKPQRRHGTAAGPHRCDRAECADMNRQWETAYRRGRRAVGAN